MDAKEDPAPFQKRLSPAALLLGVVIGFAGCCLAGHWASHFNAMGGDFCRLSPYVSVETMFFPTACHVRELVREKLPADKIGVVVGGTSRLYGIEQISGKTFADELQRQLGDEYRVINLALRGGRTTEIGSLTVEMLRDEHPRLMLVTDTSPGWFTAKPDGLVHRYFYWDAHYKGLLIADEPRHASVTKDDRVGEEVVESRLEAKIDMGELHRRQRLDSYLRFNDLWNAVGYRWCFTVWTPASHCPFTKPRQQFALTDPSECWSAAHDTPAPQRFAKNFVAELQRIKDSELFGPPDMVPDGSGNYTARPDSPRFAAYRKRLHLALPEWVRRRTVMLVGYSSAYHRRMMTADEQLLYNAGVEETVRVTRELGPAAGSYGRDFADDDYTDSIHPGRSGGLKMAAPVAALVRERARKLGYLSAEPSSSAAARTEVGGK